MTDELEKRKEVPGRLETWDVLREEFMDGLMWSLYRDEEKVARIRGYRTRLREEGRVGGLWDGMRINFDSRFISRYGATRILVDGVREVLERRSNFEEKLRFAESVLYEEPLRIPISFVSLEDIVHDKESKIYDNNVTGDISKNDGLYGFDPDDKYVSVKMFLNWCDISGQPLQDWYRRYFLPELPNWSHWEQMHVLSASEAAHLLIKVEPGGLPRTEEWHTTEDISQIRTEVAQLSDIIHAAVCSKELPSVDQAGITLRDAVDFAKKNHRSIPGRIQRHLEPKKDASKNSGSSARTGEPKSVKRSEIRGGFWTQYKFLICPGEKLRVTRDSKSIIVTPEDLGLIDRRSKTPNTLWGLLVLFAEWDGLIEQTTYGTKNWDNFRKKKGRLSKVLKEYFEVRQDPFERICSEITIADSQDTAFRCRFEIDRERPS